MADALRSKRILIGLCGLGLLGATGLVMLLGRGSNSDEEQQRVVMQAIGAATYQWQIYHGDSVCPSIRQLVDGKFLDRSLPKVDAWQQPFTVTCMDTGAFVSSPGRDRKGGTADDIKVFSPRSSPGKR